MDSSYQLQRADSPQLQETVSPQLQKTASPLFKDSGVLKDKLNDLQVVKTSPETSREIRRKLGRLLFTLAEMLLTLSNLLISYTV